MRGDEDNDETSSFEYGLGDEHHVAVDHDTKPTIVLMGLKRLDCLYQSTTAIIYLVYVAAVVRHRFARWYSKKCHPTKRCLSRVRRVSLASRCRARLSTLKRLNFPAR